MDGSKPIAIVMSEVFLRRLTPSLMPYVRAQQDFRIVDIHRPTAEVIERLRSFEPRGLITEWLPEVTEPLLALGLPTVIVDTDENFPGVTSIDVDDWAVGAAAAEALQQAGFRSLACLGNDTPYSKQRIEGFLRQVGSAVPVHTETVFKNIGYSEHFLGPDAGLHKWLRELPKPVGIFAVHDPLGRFLCSSARELGLELPEPIAVIGANNDELVCGLSYPMLSSVAIPWDRIGSLAGEAMQDLLEGKPAPERPILVAPGGVVLRHSANYLAVEDLQLRRAMAYLSEHLQAPISVGRMCHDLRLARRSLERKFRETYRCTPWTMLCRMRIARAKQLLQQTNHSVGRISELCGFNDAERMTVVFRRVTGMTPSMFRKAER